MAQEAIKILLDVTLGSVKRQIERHQAMPGWDQYRPGYEGEKSKFLQAVEEKTGTATQKAIDESGLTESELNKLASDREASEMLQNYVQKTYGDTWNKIGSGIGSFTVGATLKILPKTFEARKKLIDGKLHAPTVWNMRTKRHEPNPYYQPPDDEDYSL